MRKNKKHNTLESYLDRLDDIVNILELDKTTLNETIKLYKEGINLIKHCESEMEAAEKQIKVLIKDEDNNNFIEMEKKK